MQLLEKGSAPWVSESEWLVRWTSGFKGLIEYVWLNFTPSLEFFSYNNNFSNVTSFAQTLSVLCSFQGYAQDHPVILEVRKGVFHLIEAGKSVVFCWVPDHTCLPGYTVTDAGTREAAVLRNLTSCSTLGAGVYAFLLHAVMSSWHNKWTQIVFNKLCMMKPSMHMWHSCCSSIRTRSLSLCGFGLVIPDPWPFVKRWPGTIFLTSAMSTLLPYTSYRNTHIMMQKTNIQSSWRIAGCRWSP
jgi:hypothetical protein